MFRRDLDPEYPEPWLRASWDRTEQHERMLEERRHWPACDGTVWTPPCRVCGKDVAAKATCPACGDEDEEMAA